MTYVCRHLFPGQLSLGLLSLGCPFSLKCCCPSRMGKHGWLATLFSLTWPSFCFYSRLDIVQSQNEHRGIMQPVTRALRLGREHNCSPVVLWVKSHAQGIWAWPCQSVVTCKNHCFSMETRCGIFAVLSLSMHTGLTTV